MKNIKRTLITVLAMLLVCVLSVTATLAYITTKSDTVKNTFTIGNVAITLDEAKVGPDGKAIPTEDRVRENKYKLVAGKTYDKDPTVHIDAGSENAWVVVKVEIDESVAAVIDVNNITSQIVPAQNAKWVSVGTGSATVKYYAYKTESKAGDDLVVFETITTKSTATSTDFTKITDEDAIEITAYAVQADGITNYTEAWNAIASAYSLS